MARRQSSVSAPGAADGAAADAASRAEIVAVISPSCGPSQGTTATSSSRLTHAPTPGPACQIGAAVPAIRCTA